ncbi:MAG: type II toxin-antitoxin system ParD family antitoxin [Saprospiraceae bacterium]|nr:type II toxin-antitoxin system ParD family antitoxin [Saprospiraceae bacterium]
MQRVNLGKPYEEYIKRLVESGYYASASEVLRDALRLKMVQNELWKWERFNQLIQEGLDDVEAGRVIEYDENFWEKVNSQVKNNIKHKKEIPDHVRP